MKCHIVTGPKNYNFNKIYNHDEKALIIGADQGALILAEHKILFDIALGDFDSVKEPDLDLIKQHCKEVINYPIKKDHTDTYLAVLEAFKRGCDNITIYGGMGRRFDHTYANVNLLQLGTIEIISDYERLYVLKPGTYNISNNHKYISFFALENVKDLTLQGFEYELDSINLDLYSPLCISNSLQGTVSFSEGVLLVIHQNET